MDLGWFFASMFSASSLSLPRALCVCVCVWVGLTYFSLQRIQINIEDHYDVNNYQNFKIKVQMYGCSWELLWQSISDLYFYTTQAVCRANKQARWEMKLKRKCDPLILGWLSEPILWMELLSSWLYMDKLTMDSTEASIEIQEKCRQFLRSRPTMPRSWLTLLPSRPSPRA